MRRRAGELRDPEFDEKLDVDVDTSACPGGRCDGTGFVRVSPEYVDRRCPFPSLPDPINDLEQRQYDAIMRETSARRAALTNSSYPCPSCQPEQFAAWYAGEWDKPPKRSKPRRRDREDTPDDTSPPQDEPRPAPRYEHERMDLA